MPLRLVLATLLGLALAPATLAETRGETVDEAVFVPLATVAATLGDGALVDGEPLMVRGSVHGERQNVSFTTPAELLEAGVPTSLQSGYEGYVPKTRVVLFEAALGLGYGLSPEQALELVTMGPARILGIDERVGSLEIGKDGDVALFDGDPFEYTSHVIGVVIEGEVVSETMR